jgi:predicted CoA-binding protein
MNHDSYSDGYIRSILRDVKTIAMIGASANTVRPSYFALKYLRERGYDVIPVNPGQAGKPILGTAFAARLSDIKQPIDMVDVFRASNQVMGVVDEVLKLTPLPKYFWMQLGIRNDEAAAKLEAAGIKVVMNRCPKIEYGRLSSEIAWMGVNSRTLSAKRAPMPPGLQRLSLDRQSLGGGVTAAADQAATKRDNST